MMGFSNMSGMSAQMKASGDARELMQIIALNRSESIRLRSSVRIEFSQGVNNPILTVDIDDDGVIDQEKEFSTNSKWTLFGTETPPSDILFTGMGLASGPGTEGMQFGVKNGDYNINLRIYQTGMVKHE
jgi:hypothetical protein